MKRNSIYKLIGFFTLIVLFGTSCKKFLDVNKDPNNISVENAKIEYNLTSSQYTIAYVLGNKYQELGGFLAQYWTQLPSATQYYDYDRYSLDGSDANREWAQLYGGALRDLKFIVEKGSEDGDSNYVAIAKFLQAYTYQLLSDVHGDIPFSEALMAQDGVLGPKYDKQEDVYDGCVQLIDDGMKWLGSENAKVPGDEDVIYHGDMSMWIKFANTLKLKLAVRQSGIRPAVAQTLITELSGADFIGSGENAAVPFFENLGNRNPLYTSIIGLGVDNNVASKTIGDVLKNWGDDTTWAHPWDPRAEFMFDGSTFGAAGINGITQGAAAAGGFPSNAPRTSVAETIIGATVPVILISGTESLFLQAEAKEMMASGDGRSAYEAALVESMTYCGVDTSGLNLLTNVHYSWDSTTNHMALIALQKWVALCGTQNMESWIETRRTKVPAFTPSLATTLASGLLPQRIPYSSDEETANSNFPGQEALTKKMWWADF